MIQSLQIELVQLEILHKLNGRGKLNALTSARTTLSMQSRRCYIDICVVIHQPSRRCSSPSYLPVERERERDIQRDDDDNPTTTSGGWNGWMEHISSPCCMATIRSDHLQRVQFTRLSNQKQYCNLNRFPASLSSTSAILTRPSWATVSHPPASLHMSMSGCMPV